MARVKPIDAVEETARHRVLASLFAPLVIVASGILAYANSFAGVFMFDDRLHILGDRRLAALWPPWEALSRRRAVVDYSLALNFAFGGERPWGYHAVNLSIHLLAGLALFGLVRQTLRLPRWRGRFDTSATGIALVSATLWVVHPLQTQAVTYVIQRAESLMGLFYLVTLYAALRAFGSTRRTLWYAVAIGACAVGMGSKAVMVTAPVMVLLFDRAFLFDTFRAALRRRAALYIGLTATWGVLWATGTTAGVLNPSRVHANVGFGFKGISPLDYLLTQSGVLVRYLELSLWPAPLCLDYTWSVARAPVDILLPGLFISGLVIGTIWMYLKRPHWGFVGVWFFLVLAPTSSFVPIKDPMFEHRMYLSLAALAVGATIAGRSTVRLLAASIFGSEKSSAKLCGMLALLVGTALCYGTMRRNVVYHSEAGMWLDVRTKRPKSVRAAENYGTALLAENRIAEAYVALQDAVRSVPNSPEVRNGMGFCLVAMGRTGEAIDWFRTALEIKPHHRRARRNLASALLDTNQIDDLLDFARSALSIAPRDTDIRLTLGNGLLRIGRSEEAAEQYGIIVGIDPRNASAWRNFCVALLAKGDAARAVEAGRKAVMLDPDSADGYNNLGIALASNRQLSEAAISFRSSIERQSSALAYYNLGKCLLTDGDAAAAVVAYEGALAIDGGHNDARYELGISLATQGKLDRAIAVYEHVLLLDPSHQQARTALELARRKKAGSPSP